MTTGGYPGSIETVKSFLVRFVALAAALAPAIACSLTHSLGDYSSGGPCRLPNAVAVSVVGPCRVRVCVDGFGDCDTLPENGCETPLDADSLHCGACDVRCPSGTSCKNSECVANIVDAGDAGGCAANHADCNKDPSDGCEADTTTSERHCGSCDHDCRGGKCLGGKCQPLTLASAQGSPNGIVVDANNVYFANIGTGEIQYVTKSGGDPALSIATGQSNAWGVAVDGAGVYWTTGVDSETQTTACTVGLAPLPGASTPVQSLRLDGTRLRGVVVDATHVYWANHGGNAIQRIAKDKLGDGTTAPEVVASGDNVVRPIELAISATEVFWSADGPSPNTGTVAKVAKSALNKVTLIAGAQSGPRGVAVDGDSVYWVTATDGSIWRAPVGGGTPVKLAGGLASPRKLAIDATYVYVTTFADGRLLRARKDAAVSTSPQELWVSAGDSLLGVTVDDNYLYFVNFARGAVLRLPKP